MRTRRQFIHGVGAGLTGAGLLARALPWGGAALLWPRRAEAACTLDPQNPTPLFTKEGGQTATPGSVLTLEDASGADFVAFFCVDPDAIAGTELDVVTTFKVTSTTPNNADVGNRLVINDGATRSAIAACLIQNGVFGIGLLSTGSPSDPTSYPVFVEVDWTALTSVRLRRTAAGDAEIVEVNGVAPSPRAILLAAQCPARTRANSTVEFGARSPEARCTVEYHAFHSETVVQPVAGTLVFTHFRLRDVDSVDRIRFRADYTLGASSDGINPSVEPVTIKLSTPAGGQFYPPVDYGYPSPDFNPLIGFDVQRRAPRRRWTLNDAERARTGIEQLLFDEDPNRSGSVFLRDFRTDFLDADYATVDVEISIGTGAAADRLTGTAHLMERRFASGRWRLDTQP